MRLLLDTHALIWWGRQDSRLSRGAAAALTNPEATISVSAVLDMEVATKFRIDKLSDCQTLVERFELGATALGFEGLAVTPNHARIAGLLAIPHMDPFDRMLIAQAKVEDLILPSIESLFGGFGVSRPW